MLRHVLTSVRRSRNVVALVLLLEAAVATAPAERRTTPPHGDAETRSIVSMSGRSFTTSFESIADFAGFYIVPPGYMSTASHELTTEQVHSGTYAHKAWISGANPPSTPEVNNNHRAYPTIQLHKITGDSLGFTCPCDITLWVWLDMPLDTPGEWFSFATLTPDPSDSWSRTVLVNIAAANPAPGTAPGGVVHLMHVPDQGERSPTFQTSTIQFPQRRWVELRIAIDFDAANGHAEVWQDGQLVSAAHVNGGNGKLAQAHFGLYAAPEIASGVIYNDDLEIREAAATGVGSSEPPDVATPSTRTAAGSDGRGALTALSLVALLLALVVTAWLLRRRSRSPGS